jgi:hypothetical protein
MNTLSFVMLLLGQGVFMTLFSFAIMYGLAAVLGLADDVMDIRITFAFFVLSCITLYGSSFGVFAGVQKSTCGEVKNWKQIAMNAAIPTAFQISLLSLTLFIPWFQNVVGDLLPPDTPAFGKMAAAMAYYTFWATLMGGALGGTLSGSCKAEDVLPALPTIPTLPTVTAELPIVETFDTQKSVRFNLPPE